MAPLTNDDKILIKILHLGKVQMTREFPARNWCRSTLCDLIKRIDMMENIDVKKGSGRPRPVRTAANIQLVSDLICSCTWNFANFDILHIIPSHKKNKLLSL